MGSTVVADPLVGAVLDGRYRVDAPIARGGMATVYAAVDLRLDRRVAVKVMAPALAHDPTFTERFVREARSAARLSHPNAVAVFDQCASPSPIGPTVYLVMELVRGQTLRDLLRERGRLRPDEALSLLEPVLAALAAAHRAGLVHRDVKPENVLISAEGTVKVVDFGLARAIAAPSTSTQAGVVLGTVAYVAPEQVARGRADPRTDVYSAGILLYELLTGAPPYTGESAIAIAYRHVHDDVPPPSAQVPDLPPELDELVTRATRREPGARPADAGAMLAELVMVRVDLGLRRVPPREVAGVSAGLADGPTVALGQMTADRRTVPAGPAAAGAGRSTLPAGPVAAVGLPKAGWSGRAEPSHGRGDGARTGVLAGDRTAVLAGDRERRPNATTALPPYRPGPPRPPQRRAVATDWPVERRRRRRGLWVGLLCVLALALATGGAAWWYGSGRFVVVPPLAGLSQQAATARVTAAKLEPRVTREPSDQVAAGRVVRSDPGSGDRVLRGRRVTVVVSSGPPPVAVPNVVGRSRDDARAAVEGAGLTAELVDQPSEEVEQGTVISQQPAGGNVRRGTTVRIVISSGPEEITVPNVLGLSVDSARQQLEEAGFQVKVRALPIGNVIAQRPSAGSQRKRGSTVTIYGI